MTQSQAAELAELGSIVKLSGDGPAFTPIEYAEALRRLTIEGAVDADYYSRGGAVEALEKKMAAELGKERAVFLPTGTLANHLAVRALARGKTRVIVQQDSHLYNDSGDCAQVLSNLNLVPLAADRGTYTVQEVKAAVERAGSGKVTTGVGVLVIESPIRRRLGEMFDYEELTAVCAYAREHGIATHLDGARLYMASGYTKISPATYAAHFDTVYVSMWKYFNAPSGAILAGPSELLDGLHDARRMFGGGLPGAWPFAAIASHSIDGFAERFGAAVERGDELIRRFEAQDKVRVERIPNGTNAFKVFVDTRDLDDYRSRLRERGVLLPSPAAGWHGFAIKVNETITRKPLDELVDALLEAV